MCCADVGDVLHAQTVSTGESCASVVAVDARMRAASRPGTALLPLPPIPHTYTPCFPQEKRPGTYMAGDSLTHGDLAVFGVLSTLQSGWLDGLPTDVLDGYPALKEFRESIARLPKIKAFYDKENDDIRVKGFRARGE